MAGEDDITRDPQLIREENRSAMDVGNDAVEPRVERRDQAPGEGGEGGEDRAPIVRGSKFDEKRKRIAEMARAQREKDDDFEVVLPSRFSERIETREDRVAARDGNADPQPTPAPAPQPKRKLQVNGKEIEVEESQVIALAQKAMAAEGILDHAKAARAEAQELLAAVRDARENPPAPAKGQEETEVRQEQLPAGMDLSEIIDKIQVGDPKEAQEALQKYGNAIEERILSRIGNLDETIQTQIETVNENRRRQDETIRTLSSFGERHSDIASNRTLQAALAQETADTMRAEMDKLGVRQETIDALKAKHRMNDVQVTAFAYRTLQEKGYQLPSHAEVLESSAGKLRKSFNLPEPRREQPQTPSNVMQERTERKRMMSPQPRRASLPPSLDRKERTVEEARREAVRQMRAHRRGRA